MHRKQIFLLLYTGTILTVSIFVMLTIFGIIPYIDITKFPRNRILGEQSETIITPQEGEIYVSARSNSSNVSDYVGPVPASTSVVVQPQIPKIPDYSVGLINTTKEVSAHDMATFTWVVNGSPTVIKTSTIYFGTTSESRPLDTTVSPMSRGYSVWIADFMNGEYKIPLSFTASKSFESPGIYYARPYAEIDSKHIWGDEFIFSVLPKPKHEIRITDKPSSAKKGEGVTFVWEINGPPSVTGFTVIAYAKESYPGVLENVALTQTPYSVLVSDFTHGNINIPLRFIGNALAKESGVFYFRALVFVDNKNIWSDEYSYSVE